MTIKLPKVKGHENGGFTLEEANGWVIVLNDANGSRSGLTTVMVNNTIDAELTIILHTLEHGSEFYVILAIALDEVYYPRDYTNYIADHVNDDDNESAELEDVLTYSVNQELKRIEEQYKD